MRNNHQRQRRQISSQFIKISILGWYGNDNTGDEAILTVLLDSLRGLLPQADYAVFSANPDATLESHQVFSLQKSPAKNFFPIIRRVYSSHLLIIGGGTLIKKTVVSMLPIWFYLVVAIACRTPVMLYAQGVEQLDNPLNCRVTRFLLNRVDLITLRDELSQQSIAELGIDQPAVIVTGDPGINLPDAPIALSSVIRHLKTEDEVNSFLERPLIGLCIKGMIHSYYYPSPEAIEAEFAHVADTLIEKLNVNIIFIPMQSSGFQNDHSSSERILGLMSHRQFAVVIPGSYSPCEIKTLVGYMDVVIGMRLHALIFAASHSIPVVGISYAEKVKYFLQTIHQESWIIDLNDFSQATCVEKVCRLWQQRNSIPVQIRQSVSQYQARAATTVSYIEKLLNDLYEIV
ncbi:MAG: polysaccharide pyruvyl transferase family protein [Microcoleaceae cyanobacterium]